MVLYDAVVLQGITLRLYVLDLWVGDFVHIERYIGNDVSNLCIVVSQIWRLLDVHEFSLVILVFQGLRIETWANCVFLFEYG